MQVKATATGYYGHKRVYAGEVFKIKNEKAFSNKWMEKVEEEIPKKKPSKKASDEKVEEVDADFAAEQAALDDDVI